MAKLPSYKRIYKDDYDSEYRTMIETLGQSVNDGFDTLFEALDNGLTFSDNLNSDINTFIVSVDANGTPSTKTQFPLSTTGSISGLQVIKATNLTNSQVFPTGSPFISFTPTNSNSGISIVINNIAGLPAGYQFSITVLTIR